MWEKVQKFFHDTLGWGYPEGENLGDELHDVHSCKYCGELVERDSQGNWFHLRNY